MPAKRRSKRRQKRQNTKKKKGNKKIIKIVLVFAFILVFIYLFFSSSLWNKKQKLVLLTSSDSGAVELNIFDPVGKTKTLISVPPDMQVTAARDYGTWKLKGLKNLSENEKLGNKLVAESVMFNFSIPIDAWGADSLDGFSKGGLRGIRALFSSKDTNLKFMDRLKVLLFSMSIKNFESKEIDMSDYLAIKKTKLIDGSVGYVLSGDLPRSFYAIFAEPIFSDSQNTVKIVDKTTKQEASKKIGSIMEVMGVKIASVVKEPVEKDLNCMVLGTDKEKVKLAARIFDCSYKIKDVGSYTLEISVGDGFIK